MRYVLGSGASIGGVLGSGRGGAAAAWYLAGGVIAANCVAAYQPIGAASLAASYTNLANPGTYNAAPGTAPTWAAATGWTFNGIDQWLNSGVTPTNDQQWSMIVRFSDFTSVSAYALGVNSGGALLAIAPRFDAVTANSVLYGNGGRATKSPSITTGVLAVAGNKGYRNGSGDSVTIAPDGGTISTTIGIGARNDGANRFWFFGGKIQAVAIYNVTLTAPQVAALSAAMAAL